MGRLESNERRSNEKEVGILRRIVNMIINLFKRMFGMKVEDDDDNHKSKKFESTKNKKEVHEHSDEHSSHHSTFSDRKAGLKEDLDHFKENTEEFIEGDEARNIESHAKARSKPQHFDPKTGTKGKLDVIEPHEPVEEFLHDKENKSDDAANSKRE